MGEVIEVIDATKPNQEECPQVIARQKHDKKRGITTSQAKIDFIRRTCPCLSCKKRRTRS